MGDLQTDGSNVSGLATNHAALLHPKPLQKIAPTVQGNKENAAPNSAQRTTTKVTSKGLSARVPETRSGLSAGHTTAQATSTKKAGHGLSAVQTSEEGLGRLHGASATRSRESGAYAQKASRSDVSGLKEASSQPDASISTKTEELVASESKEVYYHLSTKEASRDDLTKWVDYFKQYCERYAFGFDVLRIVLDRIQAERPECATMAGFVELWSLWASRLALEDQYDVFKMLKNACAKNRKVAALYTSMASIKLKSGETSDALRELEKGLGYGAEPRADLEAMADSIRKSLGMGLSTRVMSSAVISQRSGLSSSTAAIMTPGTPQHLVNVDSNNTPSAHMSSTQFKPSTSATKVRSLSTPSSLATRTNEAGAKPDAVSTPSPIAQAEAAGAISALTSASGSSSAATKRRATTTLGARLGVRGGAQRIPKATSATNPTAVTNGMDVSHEEERPIALAPIDEGSALMQVDEPAMALVAKMDQVSPTGGAPGTAHVHFAPSPTLVSHVGMSAAAASLSSLYNTSSQTLGEYAVSTGGRSVEPLTGSSSSTQGFGSTSSHSSNSSSTSTSRTGMSATGLLSSQNEQHSATAMRQLAQAIPSRISTTATPQTTAQMQAVRATPAGAAVANPNLMDFSEPVAPSVAPTSAPLSNIAPMSHQTSQRAVVAPMGTTTTPMASNQMVPSQPQGSLPVTSLPHRSSSSEPLMATYPTGESPAMAPSSGAFQSSQPASQLPWLFQSSYAAQQGQYVQSSAGQVQSQQPQNQRNQQGYVGQMAPQHQPMQSQQAMQQSMQPSYAAQGMPLGYAPVGMSKTHVQQQQQPLDMSAAIESATAAAKALGRELFLVRGRPYVNLCAIGKGGTCSVYKVMDTNGGIWALKVITWTNDTIEVVKGYNEEVRLLELVQKSPYVVKLMDYEMVATSNTMYILFEFAETDLKRLFVPMKLDAAAAQVRPGGRFATDLDALRYYWRSMLSAVLVLHKSRIVHLDLKPANFVLVEGRVKIIDFGIAKKVLNDTMHAKVDDIAGTILYMAPETLKNTSGRGHPHKVGFPADVWSMGCILHQMVYGFTPFEHVSGLGPKIAAITATDPIEIQPIDNEDLMDCLRICLDKTSSNRPTIEQLLNHPFLGGFIRWAQ